MKVTIILLFAAVFTNGLAQTRNFESISISYIGEMGLHPGLKAGAEFKLLGWEKTKNSDRDRSKSISKKVILSPTLGFYYHRRYQTGILVLPELKYKRQNQLGGFYEVGFGAGYLKTFIPNTYEVEDNGNVVKTSAGHNYFVSGMHFSFGKDLSIKNDIPLGYFFKPQFVYAVPNFPKGTGYFMLEIGLNYKLN